MEQKEQVANIIKWFRTEKKISVAALEKMLGFSNGLLGKSCKENNLSADKFEKLVNLLSAKSIPGMVDKILSGEEENPLDRNEIPDANSSISIKTLYRLLTEKEISIQYLREIKEYKLFQPLIEIKDIESDPFRSIEEFKYSQDMVFKMILFVAHCFTKDSPYLKSSDTVYSTKTLILDDLELSQELRKRILTYKIPELEQVISNYIMRETNEYVREYFTAKNIYDRNLNEASCAFDKLGNIDIEKQTAYFEAAESFRNKMYKIKQNFEDKHPAFDNILKDFTKNVKSIHIVDLIP